MEVQFSLEINMLTDRQNKFLIQMIRLSQENSSATDKERKYLKSITAIQEGVKFQEAISDLNFSLVKILKERKKKVLSLEIEKLSNNLIEIYGEPIFRLRTGVEFDRSRNMDVASSIINTPTIL